MSNALFLRFRPSKLWHEASALDLQRLFLDENRPFLCFSGIDCIDGIDVCV